MYAGTALAATALALEGEGIGALILNIDALAVARDPCHYAAAL
jgi:hypothetical protein